MKYIQKSVYLYYNIYLIPFLEFVQFLRASGFQNFINTARYVIHKHFIAYFYERNLIFQKFLVHFID